MSDDTDQMLNDLRWLISNNQEATEHARAVIKLIDEVDQHHRGLGIKGMAHRHTVLLAQRPEEYDALRYEYTQASIDFAREMVELHGRILGILSGMRETLAAKAELEN